MRIIVWIVAIISLRLIRDVLLFVLKRERYEMHAKDLRFLQVKMPLNSWDKDKSNDAIQWMKQNIEVMSQVYKNFYSVYSSSWLDKYFWQPYISCELIVEKELIKFVIWVPADFLETFEKVISSFYPWCVIDKIPQPSFLDAWKYLAWWYFVLTKESEYPIKTYENFEVDPMDSILAWYARVGIEEKLWLQILVSPLTESWQKTIRKRVKKLQSWKSWSLFSIIKRIFVSNDSDADQNDEKNNKFSQQQNQDIEKKAEDEWFQIVIRGVATSPDKNRPEKMMNDLKRSLNQYNYIWLNTFAYLPDTRIEKFAKRYVKRLFSKPYFSLKKWLFRIQKQILNIKELASIFHFPHSGTNKNPRIVRQKFKIIPAPDNIPTEWLNLWYNLYGWVKKEINLSFKDRFRHFYIIWQTGTGKSTILRTMLNQDMANWAWFTLIDPHGDLAEACLEYFPKERIDDLIYRDVWNDDHPVWFNFLTWKTERERDFVTNDAVDMFIKLYGPEIFGPRLQDYFRNAVLTLMEQPEWWTLPEVMRLFTDQAFQKVKVANVKNPVVRSRWEKTYNAMGDREKAEIIPYFQSKFWPLTTTPILRNIIWQPKSSFNIGEAMNSWKALIINLSKWRVGDINANLIGMMVVSQVRLAAFRRAEIAEDKRVPHFLYIDEFQNFVTPAIESILSEARKYKLWLIIAHQYIDQLLEEWLWWRTNLKEPIFGNVGNMMSYRIWVDDAETMERQFAPDFSWTDLMNLDKFKAAIKMSVNMQPTNAFSLDVRLPWEQPALNTLDKVEIIKEINALKRWSKKELVEKEIYYRVWA